MLLFINVRVFGLLKFENLCRRGLWTDTRLEVHVHRQKRCIHVVFSLKALPISQNILIVSNCFESVAVIDIVIINFFDCRIQ